MMMRYIVLFEYFDVLVEGNFEVEGFKKVLDIFL